MRILRHFPQRQAKFSFARSLIPTERRRFCSTMSRWILLNRLLAAFDTRQAAFFFPRRSIPAIRLPSRRLSGMSAFRPRALRIAVFDLKRGRRLTAAEAPVRGPAGSARKARAGFLLTRTEC